MATNFQVFSGCLPTICDLRPCLNAETVKKWILDIFESRPRPVFNKKYPFSNFFKKDQGPGPGPQGVFLQTKLKTDTFFQRFLKKGQGQFSKMSRIHFFKVSGFRQGRKSPSEQFASLNPVLVAAGLH